MFGLMAMVETLACARTGTFECMQQLGTDPRNAMANAMFEAYIAEVDALVKLAVGTQRAAAPITAEVVDDDYSEIVGAEFVRRVDDLEDLGAPLIDLLAQTADLYKKRAEKARDEQVKQDVGQTVSLNRNLELVNYRAQVIAAHQLRQFACGLQHLFAPIGGMLLATRLDQLTSPQYTTG